VGVRVEDGPNGLYPPMLQMSDLKAFRDDRGDKSGAEQKDQTDPHPDEGVYRVINTGDLIYDTHVNLSFRNVLKKEKSPDRDCRHFEPRCLHW
jgi:hypothetical protein